MVKTPKVYTSDEFAEESLKRGIPKTCEAMIRASHLRLETHRAIADQKAAEWTAEKRIVDNLNTELLAASARLELRAQELTSAAKEMEQLQKAITTIGGFTDAYRQLCATTFPTPVTFGRVTPKKRK